MVGDSPSRKEVTWLFVRSGSLLLASIQHSERHNIHALMSRYADRPMDLADATLVYLAARDSIETILTVDQTDFSDTGSRTGAVSGFFPLIGLNCAYGIFVS